MYPVSVKRLSLILADRDRDELAPFVEAGTEHNEVLQRWAATHGADPVRSEAAALRVLLRVGVEALRDEVLDAGYRDLAASFHDRDQRDERLTARHEYTQHTDPVSS